MPGIHIPLLRNYVLHIFTIGEGNLDGDFQLSTSTVHVGTNSSAMFDDTGGYQQWIWFNGNSRIQFMEVRKSTIFWAIWIVGIFSEI